MASKKQIVVLQRGWVVVGDVETPEPVTSDTEGFVALDSLSSEVVITDASVIRRWGTNAGIGQLALEGPQSRTVLDKVGTVRVHELAIVLSIDVDEKAWA